jgi:hypothetical protein
MEQPLRIDNISLGYEPDVFHRNLTQTGRVSLEFTQT